MAEFRVTYRRRLGYELGRFGVFSATSGSTTTAVCVTAFLSSVLPTDNLAYSWLYVPSFNAPNLKQVTLSGLDSSTGTITVSGVLSAAISNSTIFELSAGLPSGRDGGASNVGMADIPGLNECVNAALHHILIEDDTVSITLVDGQYDYSTATWPWLTPERLQDVRVLNALGTAYKSTEKPWSLRGGPGAHVLHFDEAFRIASGSYSAKLVTRRPAITKIATSGVWANGTGAGLVNESDQADANLVSTTVVAKAYAYGVLRDISRGPAKADYAQKAEAQWAMARQLKDFDHTVNIADPSAARKAA